MKKRVIIVHGWSGKPDEHWLPWLKAELEKEGFGVQVPLMSQNDDPVIQEWVDRLAEVVGTSDENTYFVGHSIGCQTIMRYLASQGEKAGGCVFIAGWFKLENLEDEETEEIAKPWMEDAIDFENVLAATSKFTVFLSDNDPYNFVAENKQLFEKNLRANVTVLHEKGHFREDDGVNELPEALEALLGQTV